MCLGGRAGISLLEALVGLMILSAVLLGLAAAGGVAARQLYLGKTDMQYWLAVHEQMESLMATNFDSLASGSDTVQGHAMSWTVTGSDPKRVELVVGYRNYSGAQVQDTILMFVADPRLAIE